jgi:hypothetical protein
LSNAAQFGLGSAVPQTLNLHASIFPFTPPDAFPSPIMPLSVDTKNPAAVASWVQAKFAAMFPTAQSGILPRLFGDVTRLFTGRHPDYQPIDLRYHDFEHTLQTTVCLTHLLEGRHGAHVQPRLTARQVELAIAGALLHDSGYLRLRSDTQGTGAKYTAIHVLRSCAYAAAYLPTIGVSENELDGVLGAIRCTGPTSQIAQLHFKNPLERIVGCVLATADYLGQMAAPDYPDELELLYAEFSESYAFFHLAPADRPFASASDLIRRTPDFWLKVVLPKLENDFQAVYRFLARPYPHGPNVYLEAVARNIAAIRRRIAQTPPTQP